MMQRARRQDPYPVTWEVPLGIVVAVVMVAVLGLHMGRGIANLLAGGWWGFPERARLFTSLHGLLGGDTAAGLTHVSGRLASRAMLWTCVTVVEVAIVVSLVVTVKLVLDRWGPGRVRGLASRAEAERLLGRARLRRHAAIVRPDLYGKTGGRR